jgi:phytoene dehydrogenase-like protein
MDDVDAVVIGAGHNGLVAANMLADAGWRVLVCEATGAPGGAVASAELTAPGYVSDLCSAFYPLAAASPALLALDLEEHGLAWRHAPAVLAHVFPDGRHTVLSRDIEATATSVSSFAAADGDAWHAEFAFWQRVRDDVLAAILTPFPPVRAGARLARELGAGGVLRLARMLTLPVRTLGAERFAGDGARVLLAGSAMHTDLGPDNTGSGVFGWLLAMLGQEVGFPVPAGGAGNLTAALVRRLSARGGRIDCDRRVTSVLVAGGQAMGVADASGDVVRARRAVLADVPAPTLYRSLVGETHLPARLRADLANFRWDDATIKVDWALSGPIPWTADIGGAGTVHLGADVNGLADAANDLACGRVPRDPFLLLGQMTTADPSRSPAGTESVWAYTHVPRGSHWPASRLRWQAERMEQVIERQAPGFRDLIVGRAISGPAELESHNPSLVEGAINAGTSAVHQQLVFRPLPGLGRADTVIDRLYLAGASAHPGGGVHGAPGANAARAALSRNKIPGYAPLIRTTNHLLHH